MLTVLDDAFVAAKTTSEELTIERDFSCASKIKHALLLGR